MKNSQQLLDCAERYFLDDAGWARVGRSDGKVEFYEPESSRACSQDEAVRIQKARCQVNVEAINAFERLLKKRVSKEDEEEFNNIFCKAFLSEGEVQQFRRRLTDNRNSQNRAIEDLVLYINNTQRLSFWGPKTNPNFGDLNLGYEVRVAVIKEILESKKVEETRGFVLALVEKAREWFVRKFDSNPDCTDDDVAERLIDDLQYKIAVEGVEQWKS